MSVPTVGSWSHRLVIPACAGIQGLDLDSR